MCVILLPFPLFQFLLLLLTVASYEPITTTEKAEKARGQHCQDEKRTRSHDHGLHTTPDL